MEYTLTDNERARIRAELEYRRSLEKVDAKHSAIWTFLNSKFGSWLYGTVLVSFASLAWATAQNYLNRRENESALERARAQQDAGLMVNLLPLIAKTNSPESALGIEVMSYLAAKGGVDPQLSAAFDNVLKKVAKDGFSIAADASASEDERVSALKAAESAVSTLDQRTVPEQALSAAKTDKGNDALPPTIYLHVAREDQRAGASQAQALLRADDLLVPGVQNVGQNSPNHTEVRYFNDSDRELALRVLQKVQSIAPAAQVKRGSARARLGQVEVWFGIR